MMRYSLLTLPLLALAFALLPARGQPPPPVDVPRAHDPRLVVERFAADPDLVHPVGLDFDQRGRLLVIESHTHFPPEGYKGPPHDRIRVVEDTDGDGKADRFTTFFEGTKKTMDLAVYPDGSVYVATRNEILRLRDTDGDGKADERRRIVFLDTKGDYPHNGLSGLCFDAKGDLFFGMGENLGAAYRLVGADGTTVADEGEGGNIFWCTADGAKLRRVATGFWNPFGITRDVFGRLFAVDNDPDAMPPCRLLHVVEGGDYGYQFRYGRAGRHPFQAWDGQLPGTLPMVSGTGEAPCEVVSYESDGLPGAYRGDLLVASWADHRIERYTPKARGASFTAQRRPFVQGGPNFRPVGIAVAPDGSLFISDWVLRDYTLHGKGAIWHVRTRDARRPDPPRDPLAALLNPHRSLRESAARTLASSEAGRAFLRRHLTHADTRIRATALTSLLAHGEPRDLQALVEKDPEIGIRALALRALVGRGEDARAYLAEQQPAELRREAVGSLKQQADLPRLLGLLVDADPFLRNAAVQQLARHPQLLARIDVGAQKDGRVRAGLLLAHRASGKVEGVRLLPQLLADADEEVRFLAVKWVADHRLSALRPQVAEALKDRRLNVRQFLALSTALARLDGREVNENALAEHFFARLSDPGAPAAVRVKALQLLPTSHRKLTVAWLGNLLKEGDAALRLEAVRALSEHPSPKRAPVLLDVVRRAQLPLAVRAEALVGLAEQGQGARDELLRFALGEEPGLRAEALRALVGAQLTADQRTRLEESARRHPASAPLAARVLGRPFAQGRPAAEDTKAWLARLDGPADAEAGRRIFFHPKLAGCYRCHRVDGRGRDIGPDLSTIGQTERRHLLEAILQPSALVAPHYQAWHLETADGKTLTGMLLRTYLDEYTYLDPQGEQFKLNTRDITASRPVPTSIMPAGLQEVLADQELRDLLAYLSSRR